jgi:sugar/nucleoside kinase (ribokinase family)
VSRIVVLGDVMVDVVARLSGPVAVGSDSPASISFGGGGSAANVAAWLAFAGCPPVFVGRVGDDARGASALAELRAAGVDARLVVDGEHPTGTCVVLVGPGGERSMLPDPGANAALAVADLPDSLLVAGGHLHVTGYSLVRPGPRPAALAAISRAVEAGISVSVDPSSAALLGPDFLDLAAGAALLLPNAEEAAALTGVADAVAAGHALAARFPEVVVKLGAEGAFWTNGSKEERVPAVPVGAASPGSGAPDTTGAGDAFAAGLLAARVRGASPAEALASGCALAAQAVVTPGARPPVQGA